jgi:hypothetical protein
MGFGDFIKKIEDHPATKIASMASGAVGALNIVIGLFTESDKDQIIRKIEELREEMRKGFDEIGGLIYLQAYQIKTYIKDQDNIEALAKAETAGRELRQYIETKNVDFLANATSLSGLAADRLKRQKDPYFISGLIYAGTTRMSVMRVYDLFMLGGEFPTSSDRTEISEWCYALDGMIREIERRVEEKHRVIPRLLQLKK